MYVMYEYCMCKKKLDLYRWIGSSCYRLSLEIQII